MTVCNRFGSGGLVAVEQRVAAAHPEVGEQNTPVVKVDEEVFCTAANVSDGRSCEGSEVVRKGVAKPLTANQHVLEGLALHALHQPLTHGFNLRKFRQRQTPSERTTNSRWLSS